MADAENSKFSVEGRAGSSPAIGIIKGKFSKSERYYYDHCAIKEPSIYHKPGKVLGTRGSQGYSLASGGGSKKRGQRDTSGGFSTGSDTRNSRSVWNINTKPHKGAHFAVYPEELARRCIVAGCPEGGIVLDMFGGSGTTGAVAVQENRQFILIELNPSYVDLINRRIDGNIQRRLV